MPLLPIFVVYAAAREDDIAFQGMLTNIDSPVERLIRQCLVRLIAQNHTAAPPAIVPNKQLLISMTFFTV